VYQELRITQILSEVAGPPTDLSDPMPSQAQPRTNFIVAHRLGICSGAYPKKLLDAWDAHDRRKRSENDRPGRRPRRGAARRSS
jgi:hypothetical protein